MTVLSWDPDFGSHNFNITYRGQFERILDPMMVMN